MQHGSFTCLWSHSAQIRQKQSGFRATVWSVLQFLCKCGPILGNAISSETPHFSRATHPREQFWFLQPQSTSWCVTANSSSPCACKGCITSSQLLSALSKIRAALPSQGRLWLKRIPKVRRRHQESRRLGQVDCVGCLEAARGVGWRRGRRPEAPWLCPGEGEPANRAAGRAGTCGRAGLPGWCPEACGGQDHGKSLGLIAPQRKSYWLWWLFRSQTCATINCYQRAHDNEGNKYWSNNEEWNVDWFWEKKEEEKPCKLAHLSNRFSV